MSNPVASITRAATRRPGERLNVLTFATHERWQSGLTNCNANFYMFDAGIKAWNHAFAPLPANHFLLDGKLGDYQVPAELSLDVVLAQSVVHMPIATTLSKRLHLPLVRMEHTLTHPSWPKAYIENLRNLPCHILVTCSDYNRKDWGFPDTALVIHHGIDTDFWTPDDSVPRKAHAISVVNDFINRDYACGYNIWKDVVKNIPYQIVGETPGLSKAAAGPEELRQFYRQSLVYLNTTLISSAPVSPLEAMACGCAVVSTDTTTMPVVIEHGVNGFLGHTPEELAETCQMLLADPDLCRRIGQNARKTVVERFSVPRFVEEWDDLLNKAANIPYLGEL